MKTAQKTTEEVLTAAFLADGCKPIPVGYTPPRRKKPPLKTHRVNGGRKSKGR
jgi:hypothetical protein